MPNYDYRCTKCEHEFEKQLLIVDRQKPLNEPCPACGKKKSVVKIIMGAGIGDPVVLGVKQPNKVFQNRLKQIHDNAGISMKHSRYGQNITEI